MFWGSRGRRIAVLLAVGLALALPAAGQAVDDESKEDLSWNSFIEVEDSANDSDSSDRQASVVSWNSASEVVESSTP